MNFLFRLERKQISGPTLFFSFPLILSPTKQWIFPFLSTIFLPSSFPHNNHSMFARTIQKVELMFASSGRQPIN